MIFKELSLVFKGGLDGFLLVDILLTSVDHGDIAEAQWNNATSENVDDVRPLVPDRK